MSGYTAFYHPTDVVAVGVADDQRHQRELRQYGLQERQLDLQRVFLRERLVERCTPGRSVSCETAARSTGISPRGGEGPGAAGCYAAESHPVRGCEHHDATDLVRPRAQHRIRAGRDRARILIAGMRHDQRLSGALAALSASRINACRVMLSACFVADRRARRRPEL